MTLVEELLKMDAKKVDELKEDSIPSTRLAKLLGKQDVKIKIREIPSRRLSDLMSFNYDKKGNIDRAKGYDSSLMICSEGIIEPDLRDKTLQAHFGCSTPKDLAEKIFSNEVYSISGEILSLSGLNNEESDEEEVKN